MQNSPITRTALLVVNGSVKVGTVSFSRPRELLPTLAAYLPRDHTATSADLRWLQHEDVFLVGLAAPGAHPYTVDFCGAHHATLRGPTLFFRLATDEEGNIDGNKNLLELIIDAPLEGGEALATMLDRGEREGGFELTPINGPLYDIADYIKPGQRITDLPPGDSLGDLLKSIMSGGDGSSADDGEGYRLGMKLGAPRFIPGKTPFPQAIEFALRAVIQYADLLGTASGRGHISGGDYNATFDLYDSLCHTLADWLEANRASVEPRLSAPFDWDVMIASLRA